MLSEYRHTLGMLPINRKLQRSFDVLTRLASILSSLNDGRVVVEYCTVHCGAVFPAALNIQINPRMVHQRNHHTQLCYPPATGECLHVVYDGEKSLKERGPVSFAVNKSFFIFRRAATFFRLRFAT